MKKLVALICLCASVAFATPEKVIFDTDMGNEFKSSTVTIDVQAQATQVANNGATVLEAAGWPNPELPVA